jgi:hypothetical protein
LLPVLIHRILSSLNCGGLAGEGTPYKHKAELAIANKREE